MRSNRRSVKALNECVTVRASPEGCDWAAAYLAPGMDAAPQLAPLVPPLPGTRAALVVAHPGHELRVHGWLEVARPLTFVLTDGSGSAGEGRLASTTRVLDRARARPGSVYGRMTDREFYAAVMDHDFPRFTALASELAAALERDRIEYVAGDAVEGFNPTHDVCHLLVGAALALVSGGRSIERFDFLLEGQPDGCPACDRTCALWFRLDETALARKVAAARSYAELAGEVDRTVAKVGIDAFRVECLRPVRGAALAASPTESPYYETYGETRVAAGHYDRVIRYRDHILPLATALADYVAQHH